MIVVLDKPMKFTGLDEKSARGYFITNLRIEPLLKRKVIAPFEDSLKRDTGFSDDNIPSKQEVKKTRLGGVDFTVTTKASMKRPKYGDVYNTLGEYNSNIKLEYMNGIRRLGVLTIDDMAFISVDMLIERINEWCGSIMEGKEGVNQAIDYDEDSFKESLDKIAIDIKAEYSLLNDTSALQYLRACKFLKEAKDETVKPFEQKLKESTGYCPGNMPSETQDSWQQIGDFLFLVKTIPRPNTSYAEIINGLVKEQPKPKDGGTTGASKSGKAKSKSAKPVKPKEDKSGLLIRIRDDSEEERVKQFVRMRDDRKYISIDAFSDEIKRLTEASTEKTIRQEICLFPIG